MSTVPQLTAEQMYKLTHRERCIVNKIDMDSLPKPYGNWQTEYAARQTKLNIHLVISAVACFVATYVVSLFSSTHSNIIQWYLILKMLLESVANMIIGNK